jgi:hypothetical protein
MSEHYSQLLIPKRPDFAPPVSQVAVFFKALQEHGSAPHHAEISISKQSEKVRMGRNAFTGEQITIRLRESVKCESLTVVERDIEGLDDYSVILVGQGPAQIPPFPLFNAADEQCQSEVREPYYYEVSCNLRPGGISFSKESWHAPCDLKTVDAVTSNPWNGHKIRIPEAGCARFWIEFMFGNWLVPRIDKSLDILTPAIPTLTSDAFGIAFTQSGIFL